MIYQWYNTITQNTYKYIKIKVNEYRIYYIYTFIYLDNSYQYDNYELYDKGCDSKL